MAAEDGHRPIPAHAAGVVQTAAQGGSSRHQANQGPRPAAGHNVEVKFIESERLRRAHCPAVPQSEYAGFGRQPLPGQPLRLPIPLASVHSRPMIRPNGPEHTQVSVCIATYRRPEGLGRLLTSLTEQQGAPPFDVIVVDNDAQHSGEGVATRYCDRLNLMYVVEIG